MLLEIAIGDAYGAGFEFNETALDHNDLSRYLDHGLHSISGGQYTDDTQMSLAVAEALVEGDRWTPVSLAERFCSVFHRDPRPGYSGGFYDFLQRHITGAAFVRNMHPRSSKCGAAMRVCPVGLLPFELDVIRKADLQARITHDSPAGRASAVATAMAVHYAFYQIGAMKDLGHWLNARSYLHVDDVDWASWEGAPSVEGVDVVRAAIAAVSQHHTLSDVLRAAVAYGGDTDSVAAIALGISSVSGEHLQDLPKNLHDGLERSPFGYDYLVDLDRRLMCWASQQVN